MRSCQPRYKKLSKQSERGAHSSGNTAVGSMLRGSRTNPCAVPRALLIRPHHPAHTAVAIRYTANYRRVFFFFVTWPVTCSAAPYVPRCCFRLFFLLLQLSIVFCPLGVFLTLARWPRVRVSWYEKRTPAINMCTPCFSLRDPGKF